MPGWRGSTRKARLPRDWSTRRRAVLARDGGVCQWPRADGGVCGAPATDVDHVQPGDDHSLANLRALCRWHHQRKSGSEGGRALWRRAPSRRRPSEPPPGDL